jgi:nucleoporin POM34
MYNGLYALRPLVKATDDLSDIPLTPSQRALLGLAPSSTPATPGGAYITPPRYSHSTPRSSSSRAAIAGSSPLGRSINGSPLSGSPLADRGFGSGLSNSNNSPMGRKVLPGQRYSLGDSRGRTPSLGGLGLDESSTSLPPTPSPTGGQRAVSVSLNNKWLYQRQKASPGGKSLYF